jgi:hypothetical protein
MRYKPRQQLGERFDVRGYIPPAQLVEIAEDRTDGIVSAFIHLGARASHVQRFANSCYMQGVNDAIDAINKAGLKVVRQ